MDGDNDDTASTTELVVQNSDCKIDTEIVSSLTVKSPETINDQQAIAYNTDELKEEHKDLVDVDDSKTNNIIILRSITEDNKEQIIKDNIAEKITKRRKHSSIEVPLSIDHTDSAYDTFIDSENTIYKKYRLRAGRKPNYRDSSTDIPSEPKIKVEVINCPQCTTDFKRCSDFRKHFRNNHDMIYTCLLCTKTFETNQELIEHKATHDDEDLTYLCHECKEAFSNHHDYLMHELTHSNTKSMYTCPECGFIYYKKYSYVKHIYTHVKKPLICPVCSKECNGEFNLNSHIRKHSINLKCVECGMAFNEQKSYDAHMALHTGVKKYQCLYCGKAFRLIQQRTIHTRIHTQEKPFKCEKCDERFRISIDYQRHFNVKHETMKKLTCPVCKKNFKDKSFLASHMSVHSKEYKCPECYKDYASIQGLKAHILYAHITEKREACLLCNMKFIDQNSLKRHLKSKAHKNNEYKDMLLKNKSC